MTDFARTHAAIFDELERQRAMHVDVARLTRAVLAAQAVVIAEQPRQPYRRCANGACEG
jgi:hypothetical protein